MLGRNSPRLLKQFVPPVLGFILGYLWRNFDESPQQEETGLENVKFAHIYFFLFCLFSLVILFCMQNFYNIIFQINTLGFAFVHGSIRGLVDPGPVQPRQQRVEEHHQADLAQPVQEEPQLPGVLRSRRQRLE